MDANHGNWERSNLKQLSDRNDNLLVIEATGARYVLRCFRRNPDARRVEFQVWFQHHLRRGGFPTAEVVEARSGTFCVLADEGLLWVLFTHDEKSAGSGLLTIGKAARLGTHTMTAITGRSSLPWPRMRNRLSD